MGWRLAFGLVATCTCIACGGRTDLGVDDDGGTTDASLDAKPKDGSKVDVVMKPDVYVPLGTKCSPPTSMAPPPWTPDDAGAPLHPPYVASSGGPTIANPAFVAITFEGDENRDSVEDLI